MQPAPELQLPFGTAESTEYFKLTTVCIITMKKEVHHHKSINLWGREVMEGIFSKFC